MDTIICSLGFEWALRVCVQSVKAAIGSGSDLSSVAVTRGLLPDAVGTLGHFWEELPDHSLVKGSNGVIRPLLYSPVHFRDTSMSKAEMELLE